MKIEDKNLEYRMYIFVPYNISDIQKGIQAGHAVEQYARLYGNNKEYIEYVDNHKTWIILNGGTTNNHRDLETGITLGTLNQIKDELEENEIKYACFNEPDLNNALSAVCFLADERVFSRDYYSFEDWCDINYMGKNNNPSFPDAYNEYKEEMGGEGNIFLRNLITGKSLA
jgi:hypothetical protein